MNVGGCCDSCCCGYCCGSKECDIGLVCGCGGSPGGFAIGVGSCIFVGGGGVCICGG